MSKDLNKVMLIGRLGQDPELKYTQSGVAVAKFSVATGQQWKDQEGNQQERTEWHNIVAWRRLAEICAEYLKKGKKVYIEGSLNTNSWEDENKKKHYKTEIVLNEMIMLDGLGGGGQGKQTGEKTAAAPASDAGDTAATGGSSSTDDLPF